MTSALNVIYLKKKPDILEFEVIDKEYRVYVHWKNGYGALFYEKVSFLASVFHLRLCYSHRH